MRSRITGRSAAAAACRRTLAIGEGNDEGVTAIPGVTIEGNGMKIRRTKPGAQGQSSSIAPPYWVSTASAVTRRSGSVKAWASSRRSNGSA